MKNRLKKMMQELLQGSPKTEEEPTDPWDDVLLKYENGKTVKTIIHWQDTKDFRFRQSTKYTTMQDDPNEFLLHVEEYAQHSLEIAKRILGYEIAIHPDAIEKIDGILEIIRSSRPAEESVLYYVDFGCLLGQIIQQETGWNWEVHSTGAYAVASSDGNSAVFPIDRCRKRYESGEEESVADLWSTLNALRRSDT